MFAFQRAVSFEPLADLAIFAWEAAPGLCERKNGCEAYHRTWSLIRLLDQTSFAPAGADVLRQGFAHLTGRSDARILLSGGADTGVTALAADVLQQMKTPAQLVFADRCATPVMQNERFAAAAGLPLEVIQTDILALDVAPFDSIVAHSFLGFFPPEKRAALMMTWSRLLKPGGTLVLINRIATDPQGARKAWSEAGRAALAERLRAAAVRADLPLDADTLAQVAALDPRPKARYPRLTQDELHNLVADAGLTVEQVTFDQRNLAKGAAEASASIKDSVRAGLIARKP